MSKVFLTVIIAVTLFGAVVSQAFAFGRGAQGPDVYAVQAMLKSIGYYAGPITGNYGTQTEAGVKYFQQRYGLEQTGAVNDETLQSILWAYGNAKIPKKQPPQPTQPKVPAISDEEYQMLQLVNADRQSAGLKPFAMDEPLSNLDAKLRVQTRTQIAALQKRLNVTTVYVTHDQVEAMTMGDRVAVLKDGVLQQVASPRDLYEKPTNAFVASFIGSPSMSITQAKLLDGGAEIGGFKIPLERSVLKNLGDLILIGIRPEDFEISNEGIPLSIELVEELGADSYIYGNVNGHKDISLIVKTNGSAGYKSGQQINVKPRKTYCFSVDGENSAI
jgi:peptidoglycan hydrolase-like protein with peptidoglycan-binding domain